jgi:hypothetical protein
VFINKQVNFKTDGLDVYYLTTWVSLYQVIVGFAFIPLLALPGFGGVSATEIPGQVSFTYPFSCPHLPFASVPAVNYNVIYQCYSY